MCECWSDFFFRSEMNGACMGKHGGTAPAFPVRSWAQVTVSWSFMFSMCPGSLVSSDSPVSCQEVDRLNVKFWEMQVGESGVTFMRTNPRVMVKQGSATRTETKRNQRSIRKQGCTTSRACHRFYIHRRITGKRREGAHSKVEINPKTKYSDALSASESAHSFSGLGCHPLYRE